MPEISMKNLLSAGAHFGHQTHRWNPKMKPYIYGPRDGIYIIDLEKTVKNAQAAFDFLKSVSAEGQKVLFVATKKQAKDTAKEAAARCSMPFVVERWLGGTLTNFQTIRRGVEHLLKLETMKQDGTYEILPKKETVRLERKRKKLDSSLGGLRDMRNLPGALFIIDPETEKIAVREANRVGIPVVAVVDTNCDPDPIDYVIPGNDDALKSVSLFLDLASQACLEGVTAFEQTLRRTAAPAPAAEEKKETAEARPSGPIVERVVRRSLRIPTEIDPNADLALDEEEIEAAKKPEEEPEK